MNNIKKILPSILLILIIWYTLSLKYMRMDEIGYIFYTVWEWMKIFLSPWIGSFFAEIWLYLIASIETIAIILLGLWFFIKKLKFYGWLLALIVLIWAIFFHIFTPLWINMNDDNWKLFFMAIIWFISAFYITITEYKSCIIK